MKDLYIFVDSERPDQYLNSIVFCVTKLDVRRINFVHIKRLTNAGTFKESPGLSARVMGAVQTQIQGLAEQGEYLDYQSGLRTDLGDFYTPEKLSNLKDYYKRFRNLPLEFSNRESEYSKLRELLADISRNKEAIVDITAIRKRYMGDIVAAALIEGIHSLWTFDIQPGMADYDRPWNMLIYELERQPDLGFSYTDIIDTNTYKSCMKLVFIRAPKFRVAVILTILLLITAVVSALLLESDSKFLQILGPVSSIASILSLSYVFWAPRGTV